MNFFSFRTLSIATLFLFPLFLLFQGNKVYADPTLLDSVKEKQVPSSPLPSTSSPMNEVKLFQSFSKDATIAERYYFDAGLFYGKDYEFGNTKDVNITDIGVRGGYKLAEDLEIGVDMVFRRAEFEYKNNQNSYSYSNSGLLDLAMQGRFRIINKENLSVAAGGFLTLPIGNNGLNLIDGISSTLGAYGAVRYVMTKEFTLTGNAGLSLLDRELGVELGVGTIFQLFEPLHIISELVIKTEEDYLAISGGVDNQLPVGRIRGNLVIGLDDGAPDFGIGVSYLMHFK